MALPAGLLGAALLLGAVLAAPPPPARAHVILEPQVVERLLADIGRFRQQSREGDTEEGRLEALYQMGESVRGLVELMDRDVGAHGAGDLFGQLIAKRLREHGLGVAFTEETHRYRYDFAAFHEYLRRAPRGTRAIEIRYRLIADAFYRTLSPDSPAMLRGSAEELLPALEQAEGFLRDFPNDPRAKEVRLFRATDYYRLSRSARDATTARRYAELARKALRELVARHGGTPEARAAEGLLERLEGAPGD